MIRAVAQNQLQFGESPATYYEFSGKSSDTKPTEGVANGSYFLEMDTGNVYAYDEEGEAWLKILELGGGS